MTALGFSGTLQEQLYYKNFNKSLLKSIVAVTKAYFGDSTCHLYTVRTVAADLRRGEHIPKMQNNIGRKSTLRVLRQLRSKDGGEGGVLDTVPGRAARRSARHWVLYNCPKFKLDRIRQRHRQKHQVGSNHLPSQL